MPRPGPRSDAAPLVVVGSSNTDLILQVDRLPRVGETRLGGRFAIAAGGKGANQAVAAARAGGRVSFIGRLGDDGFGRQALRGLRTDDIDVSHVVIDKACPSGTALILVDRQGRNMIAVAASANARLAGDDVTRARSAFLGARVVLVQLETPLVSVAAAVRLGAQAGATVILNPAPARRLPDRLLNRISMLTPNESEAEALTGLRVDSIGSAGCAAARLRDRGVKTVIITLGARGAFVSSEGVHQRVAGFRVRAVDTTGAGDVFNGALAVAIADSRTLVEAVKFANAAAAVSVTRRGAQASAPTRGEIERMLRGAGRTKRG